MDVWKQAFLITYFYFICFAKTEKSNETCKSFDSRGFFWQGNVGENVLQPCFKINETLNGNSTWMCKNATGDPYFLGPEPDRTQCIPNWLLEMVDQGTDPDLNTIQSNLKEDPTGGTLVTLISFLKTYAEKVLTPWNRVNLELLFDILDVLLKSKLSWLEIHNTAEEYPDMQIQIFVSFKDLMLKYITQFSEDKFSFHGDTIVVEYQPLDSNMTEFSFPENIDKGDSQIKVKYRDPQLSKSIYGFGILLKANVLEDIFQGVTENTDFTFMNLQTEMLMFKTSLLPSSILDISVSLKGFSSNSQNISTSVCANWLRMGHHDGYVWNDPGNCNESFNLDKNSLNCNCTTNPWYSYDRFFGGASNSYMLISNSSSTSTTTTVSSTTPIRTSSTSTTEKVTSTLDSA